jgi:hypothetical protein
MICTGTRHIIYSMSNTLRKKLAHSTVQVTNTMCVKPSHVQAINNYHTYSIVTESLITSLSSSNWSGTIASTREANENDAAASPCKFASSSKIAKSSSLRSSSVQPLPWAAADTSSPLLILSSLPSSLRHLQFHHQCHNIHLHRGFEKGLHILLKHSIHC